MKKIVLNIDGMVCSSCENRIQNFVKNKYNIDDICANHKDGTLTITFRENLDVKQLKNDIKDIGFSITEG